MIPAWASERISREVDATLASPDFADCDPTLASAIQHIRVWPVYRDLGGTLLLGVDGEVYTQNHNTMEIAPESDLRWRLVAWVSAAERVPELRMLLPPRPTGTPDCRVCGGAGNILIRKSQVGCGVCWGLGWCLEFPH
jgi:hypothetical protein